MTVKEYLSQAYMLDQRINAHLEEVKRLRDMATGELLPTQTGKGPRGRLAETVLTLAPGESRDLRTEYAPAGQDMAPHTPGMCA
ncbi:MAG: hypothetical protein IKW76_13165, partial [Clostridia bacterium]|nr:hypothetical protein [Clostridia bacterium]